MANGKQKKREKVVINYPPVPTRTWIPPDQRPKKPKPPPAYVKPKGITQPLKISSLRKCWNNFWKVKPEVGVLTGHFSQCYGRFGFNSNGYQGPCNCVVAIVFARMFEMKDWCSRTVDTVLIIGDDLYRRTLTHLEDKCVTRLSPADVYTSFYIDTTQVTITMIGKQVKGRLVLEFSDGPCFIDLLEKFFEMYPAGVVSSQCKEFAVWTKDDHFYAFDPTDHDNEGLPWGGIKGHGMAVVMRFVDSDLMALWILSHLDKSQNANFTIYPCIIQKLTKIDTTPPKCLQDIKIEPPKEEENAKLLRVIESRIAAKAGLQEKPVVEEEVVEVIEYEPSIEVVLPPEQPVEGAEGVEVPEREPNLLMAMEEYSPDVINVNPEEEHSWLEGITLEPVVISESRIPIEPPRVASISYFQFVEPDKVGILRASIHQGDPKFQRYAGQIHFAAAVTVLAMLRVHKSKLWYSKVLDEVLTVAQFVHHSTVQSLAGTTKTMRLSNIYDRIPIADREFMPVINEYTVVGRLSSPQENILDLQPALEEFFREYDACVIWGPLTLAVWLEDGLFYMFDPNERDKNGLRIVRQVRMGSSILILDVPPGFACVTWFKSIKNLVKLYMENVEPTLRRETFVLNRVQIKDYVKKPDPWYNFTGLSDKKWILRGRMNQNDKQFSKETRNTQSTATSIVALAVTKILEEKQWTRDTLDEILIEGNELYAKTVEHLVQYNKFVDPKLHVDEVLKDFPLMSVSIKLEVESCKVNAVINARRENDVLNIKKGLDRFFSECDFSVITARGISAAVWKKSGAYFYMNPRMCDEEGMTSEFGLACVVRCTDLEEIAKMIEGSLGPGTEEIFNISAIFVTVHDTTESGVVRPPLKNYKALNERMAILRSIYSVRSDVFDTIAGKHAVPCCLIALGMNQLYPALLWSRDQMDEILNLGKELYIKSMIAKEKAGIEEDEDSDVITLDNVVKEFKIGFNKMEVVHGDVVEGNFEEDFANHILTFYMQEGAPEDHPKELLLESETLVYLMWRTDEGIYFLYDPRARDERGQVYGKDEWSAKYEPEEQEEEGEDVSLYDMLFPIEMGAGDAPKPSQSEQLGEKRHSAGSQTEEDEERKRQEAEARRRQIEEQRRLAEEQRLLEEAAKEAQRLERLQYWSGQELKSGKACVMWFTHLETLLEHIIENTPPNRRINMPYKLTTLKVVHKPEMKTVFDPEAQPRSDLYAGDWYEFKELDYGRWILRGNMSQEGNVFPVVNRGKQSITNCYTALAHAHFYSLTKFKPITIDAILKYGDRLFTYTKNLRKEELMQNKDLKLSEEVIEEIVNNEHYEVEDYVRKFCIAEHRVRVLLGLEAIKGDVNAPPESEEMLDVKRGLEEFFVTNNMGILISKTQNVAVWRGENVYYMFDPNPTGPSGVKTPNGEACITRYLNLETMAEVFLDNLPKEGKNQFVIHRVKIEASTCCRDRQPEPVPEPPPPDFCSFKNIQPGKYILRGTLSQDDSRFGRGRNVQCAPIAIVALTMTLLHNCQNWTRPIVDEIVILGDELYTTSVDRLAYDFNPWEQGMSIYQVQKDYQIGSIKANCEIRHMDQKGVINIKHPKVLNLRQGIEKFFIENTHGVLQTEDLTVALWELEEGPETIIYMFDPNPRGPTGMPFPAGTACVATFVNAKMAFDHILSLIPEEKRLLEFVITPVEIVVGRKRTPKKKCPCCAFIKKKLGGRPQPVKEGRENLPRCSEKAASEEARKMRKYAEEQRRRKEANKRAKLGRMEYYTLPDGDGLLRGMRSQSSCRFSSMSRGNQDIPNCVAAYVMHCMYPISNWTHKNIDTVLDIGEQLYIDSYITYSPKDPKLGFRNVLRRFSVKNVQVEIVVYKPSLTQSFLHTNLTIGLMNYFQQENFGIVSALEKWVGVFFKGGYYYIFDPHDRDHEGNRTDFNHGTAVVFKCQNLSGMASKIMEGMITDNEESVGEFSINLLTVKEIKMLDTDKGVLRDNL